MLKKLRYKLDTLSKRIRKKQHFIDFSHLISGERFRLTSLRKKYKGHRCFIIATGPSLNQTNLTELSDEFTFAVKSFLFSGIDRFKLVPSFFCWSDRQTLQDNISYFPKAKPDRMICFFPFFLRRYIQKNLKWNTKDVYFINDIYGLEVHKGIFFESADNKLLCSGSVIIDYCIPLAIHMGFNPIYLIGCDHDSPDGVRYFDGKSTSLSGGCTPWKIVDQAFSVVKKHADAKGIKIYNATEGGRLEIFERVTLKDII